MTGGEASFVKLFAFPLENSRLGPMMHAEKFGEKLPSENVGLRRSQMNGRSLSVDDDLAILICKAKR